MLPKRFCDLIGCRLPIQLAGMGQVAGIELAAAVSSHGGLGMVAMPSLRAQGLQTFLAELSGRVEEPVGINFLVPFLDLDCVALAAEKTEVVEWFYGEPDKSLVDVAHHNGALAGWQVGSADDALLAVQAGCDYVVVQGIEAGGHIAGKESLWSLLNQVAGRVDIPLVAAGGLGNASSVAAAFAAGADAVRVGTRFVAALEADAHPEYVNSLVAASAADTELTVTFGANWPDAPHRVLRSAIERVETHIGDAVGEMDVHGTTRPIQRLSPSPPNRSFRGSVDAAALYAGYSVDDVKRSEPAADIVAELMDGAEEILGRTDQ